MSDSIFFQALTEALPEWMSLRPFRHWLSLGVSVALVVDAVIEGLFEGRTAAMPGQVSGPGVVGLGGFDNVDALPLIGRDRRILRGFTETPADYARRLRAWRAAWRRAGTAFGLLDQLRGILGPTPPRVRLVTRDGLWYTIEEDGSLVLNTPAGGGFRLTPAGILTAEPDPAHPWDWSSASTPPVVVDPDEILVWLILYAPTNPPLDADGGIYVGGRVLGTPGATIGTSSTTAHVELIQGLADEWKPAGVIVDTIIIAFDPASFDPLTPGPYPAAGMPDGTWAHYGKNITIGGAVHRMRARLETARYWRGAAG